MSKMYSNFFALLFVVVALEACKLNPRCDDCVTNDCLWVIKRNGNGLGQCIWKSEYIAKQIRSTYRTIAKCVLYLETESKYQSLILSVDLLCGDYKEITISGRVIRENIRAEAPIPSIGNHSSITYKTGVATTTNTSGLTYSTKAPLTQVTQKPFEVGFIDSPKNSTDNNVETQLNTLEIPSSTQISKLLFISSSSTNIPVDPTTTNIPETTQTPFISSSAEPYVNTTVEVNSQYPPANISDYFTQPSSTKASLLVPTVSTLTENALVSSNSNEIFTNENKPIPTQGLFDVVISAGKLAHSSNSKLDFIFFK